MKARFQDFSKIVLLNDTFYLSWLKRLDFINSSIFATADYLISISQKLLMSIQLK